MKLSFIEGNANHNKLVRPWQVILDKYDHALSIFQSPEWVKSIAKGTQNQNVKIGLVQGDTGEIMGVVPFIKGSHKIKYLIKAKTLFSVPVETGSILGSILLLPENNQSHDLFIETFFDYFFDCQALYFDSVPVDSFLWKYFNSSAMIRNKCIVHISDGIRKHFSLILKESFDEYLAGFKSKRRSELRRRLKYFKKNCGDNQELVRIDSKHQVQYFLEMAALISSKSWQHEIIGCRIDTYEENCKKLMSLAEKQMLRAYLLLSDGIPCAFRLGYQYGATYLSVETGYDQAYRVFSPGKVLTLKMIEDFFLYNRPKNIDFGIGNAQWKQDLCNVESQDVSVLLMRKTIRNNFLTTSHTIFYFYVQKIKKYIDLVQSKKNLSLSNK